LLAHLLPTAAGYFPRAEGHHVERAQGVAEVIIILCQAGRGWFEIGGNRRPVEFGEVIFIPAGIAHMYGADDDDPWSIVWAHAVGVDVHRFMRALGIDRSRPKLRLSADVLDKLNFHRVYQVMEEGYSLPLLIVSASALRLTLSEMLHGKVARRVARDADAGPVQRVSDWMRNNIAARVSLTQLARQSGVSASHLSALFRNQAGYPPMDYFLRLKVQHACRLLDTTAMRIQTIGAEIGYPDPYYFSRLFREVMGVSPRAYRAITKGDSADNAR
jgi:AraC-like DNA-binding protein